MERIDFMSMMPEAMRGMYALQKGADSVRLPDEIVELVKLRASQINGCAYCSDRHIKDSIAMGMDPMQLHMLPVWREAECFSAKERAAIGWAEAITRISETAAPDDVYEELAAHFAHEQIVKLTWELVIINGWNRLVVGTRKPVDVSYKSAKVSMR